MRQEFPEAHRFYFNPPWLYLYGMEEKGRYTHQSRGIYFNHWGPFMSCPIRLRIQADLKVLLQWLQPKKLPSVMPSVMPRLGVGWGGGLFQGWGDFGGHHRQTSGMSWWKGEPASALFGRNVVVLLVCLGKFLDVLQNSTLILKLKKACSIIF